MLSASGSSDRRRGMGSRSSSRPLCTSRFTPRTIDNPFPPGKGAEAKRRFLSPTPAAQQVVPMIHLPDVSATIEQLRSEERRVGKECRYGWWTEERREAA